MKLRIPALILFLPVVGLLFPQVLLASTDHQLCPPSAPCNIGEFLYDDAYAPIATATCTITSRYPNGTIFLNAASMTGNSDGWYNHTVSAPSTLGIYRSQICCTSGTDYMCLDKSFEVAATPSGATAADVWGYSSRSLTSFGTLVSDIWGYSSRSLSSFGSLIGDIWGNATRTITGGAISSVTSTNTTIVTKEDIKIVTENLTQNRVMIEQLVNKPIVQTTIDVGEVPNLESKIEHTQNTISRLYTSVQSLKSRSDLMALRWNALSAADIRQELKELDQTLTQDSDREKSNVIARTDWLKKAWGNTLTIQVADLAYALGSQIKNLQSTLEISGKPKSPSALKPVISHLDNLERLIGNISHDSREASLYGFLKKTKSTIEILDRESNTLSDLFAHWQETDAKKIEENLKDIYDQVIAVNQVPNPDQILESKIKKEATRLKNRALALVSLISTNRLILALDSGKSVNFVWLEEGSVVFRSVVTNPSSAIPQTVPVKIYLPIELKKEQIIKIDPELTVRFDIQENTHYVEGEVTLKPLETKTFLVETEDVWTITEEEIESVKKQAEELTASLKNTAFYAQGISLKTDADVDLNKIALRQKQAVTPESRIKTYRESKLEMIGVEEKINTLKLLVIQANSAGSIFGFVGGVQTIAVWGLIIIIITGFIFLSLYIRSLNYDRVTRMRKPPITGTQSQSRLKKFISFFILALLTASLTSFSVAIIIAQSRRHTAILGTSNDTKTQPADSQVESPVDQ